MRASDGAGGSRQRLREQLRRLVEVERSQRQLVELARAAQVVAQAADPVGAREAVGAVGGDHEQRQLTQRLGERGQDLQRRLVGPLQVVEEDDGVALGRDRGERRAQRLEQRRRGRRPPPGSPSSGSSSASSARSGPTSASASGSARSRLRRAATSGPYGAVPPSVDAPRRTSASDALATSAASRVLPTPASPQSSTRVPCPCRARRASSSSRARSACRPTRSRPHPRSLGTACRRVKYGNPADDRARVRP